MKQKKLPVKGKHKGLYVYCSVCKSHFGWTKIIEEGAKIEPRCGLTKVKLSSCKNLEKHRYKVRINLPKTKRKRSRVFDVLSYQDAVVESVKFETEVLSFLSKNTENGLKKAFKLTSVDNKKGVPSSSSPIKSKFLRYHLLDLEMRYLDYLDNVDVPAHKRRERSSKYINAIQKDIKLFNDVLTMNNIDVEKIYIDEITDEHVGYFHSYILTITQSGSTYNKKISSLKTMFAWSIKKYKLKEIENPFEDVRTRSMNVDTKTITKEEYKKLLDIISPENGQAFEGKTKRQKRNRYKPYLKDGIELALNTGGRREEVATLKWNMIIEKDGEPLYVLVKNLKVERLKGDGHNKDVPPKVIPVTAGLRKLLYRLGYQNKKGLNEYILSPDRTKTSTLAIMENLSKGFSHFYNQLGTGREIQLKHLRKTYLTYLNAAMGKNTKKFSSHSSDEILERHYIDQTVVHKAVKKVQIFG
ncbi:hypothetical protein [uncultured Algibacter sp.]|uniref:hypothetical protein n=1 Tax=uncultured Algibacter sp. TaxID=298659 RepID=UPI003217988D